MNLENIFVYGNIFFIYFDLFPFSYGFSMSPTEIFFHSYSYPPRNTHLPTMEVKYLCVGGKVVILAHTCEALIHLCSP